MATNQQTWNRVRQFHTDVVELDGYISIAANASVVAAANEAVAGMAGRREPIAGTSWADNATVAKNGTGVYEVTLNGSFVRLLSCSAELTNPAGGTLDLTVDLGDNNIKPGMATKTQKLVFITRKKSDGSVVNPSAVCGIRFHARLKNS